MKINKFFEEEYLVPGNTYDNFIFENCPIDVLELAKVKLKEGNTQVKPCVVFLSREKESCVEPIINNCKEEYHKKILARDYVVAMIMKQLLKYTSYEEEKALVDIQLKAFLENNFVKVKEMHSLSFMPYDVKRMAKKIGKIELTFILENTQNKYIQQAINIFISSRESYSVKIFTNKEKLSSYYDLDGNMIECPHDFMRRDINNFIEHENKV